MTTPSQSTIIPFFRPFGSAGLSSTRLPTGKRGAAVIWGETRLPAQPIVGRCVRIDTSARRPTIRWRGGEAPKTTSTHLMLPGGPSTDDLPARRRAALGLIQPVHSSGTSLYPNRGEGSPLAASFCVRPNARAPSGNQVWCYGSPCRPLLACAGGGQHPSLVSTALPCQEATLATFRQLIRRVHLRNLITTRFLCHFEVASSSGRHPSADATYNGTRWVVRL